MPSPLCALDAIGARDRSALRRCLRPRPVGFRLDDWYNCGPVFDITRSVVWQNASAKGPREGFALGASRQTSDSFSAVTRVQLTRWTSIWCVAHARRPRTRSWPRHRERCAWAATRPATSIRTGRRKRATALAGSCDRDETSSWSTSSRSFIAQARYFDEGDSPPLLGGLFRNPQAGQPR
jgi:hypothetical protein